MENGKHLISCFSITGIKIRPRADRGGVVSLSQGLCGGWVCVQDEECKEENDHVGLRSLICVRCDNVMTRRTGEAR